MVTGSPGQSPAQVGGGRWRHRGRWRRSADAPNLIGIHHRSSVPECPAPTMCWRDRPASN